MNEIDKLKKIIDKNIEVKKYEIALAAISACSKCYYEWNQFYTDEYLESKIESVMEGITYPIEYLKSDNTILFYDGFGCDTRGLALIYLKALTHLQGKKIVYITNKAAQGNQVEINRNINKSNIIFEYLDIDKGYTAQINILIKMFEKYKPANAFLYTYPYDVSAVIAFQSVKNIVRYQINLTDHAFWIGKNAFDYCIEFRSFGYAVSQKFRQISESKLIILPFYPFIDYTIPFEGLPFELGNKKLIFSGGALYKTISKDNTYYNIINKILENNIDVIFLYAGTGDATGLHKLIDRFPGRVYYISERKDLFQLMKKCYLYINTYPLLGGLMTQYAVAAGRLPITLNNGQVQDGFLINQSDIKTFYETEEDLLCDVQRLIDDYEYKVRQERLLIENEYIIKPETFMNELELILNEQKSSYEIEDIIVNMDELKKEYEMKFNKENIRDAIISKRNKKLYKYFPLLFISKVVIKLKK